MSSKTFNNTKINVEFDEDYQSRTNINSGENISSLFAKIRRFILDLKAVCFSGSYNDLSDTPDVVTKEYVDPIKSQAAINRTTLGYQCKNLHDTLSVNWYQPGKTSVASDGTVTTTITSDPRSFTYANSEHYITLEAGNYIITANTLKFVAGSSALIRGCNSDNQSLFSLSVSSAGLHKTAFSLSEKTTIGIMYKLYSQTCTIMLRYADILDGTYEPYQPSVQEQIVGAYFPMTAQKGIGDNTDLNTITEVGNYICWSGSSASTMSNCPTTSGAFRLIVTNRFQDCNESDNLRYQWIIPNNQDFVLYYRRSFNTSTNSFGSWYSFGGTVVS